MQSTALCFRQASAPGFGDMIGSSQELQKVWESVQMVAQTDSGVLIRGETGTGKELLAKAIHEESLRSQGPFVKINCAAMPAELLESELFGHERGAFRGVPRKRVSMRKIHDVLRLHFDLKLPQRQIARSIQLSQSTVNEYLRRFEESDWLGPCPTATTTNGCKRNCLAAASPTRRPRGGRFRICRRSITNSPPIETPACNCSGRSIGMPTRMLTTPTRVSGGVTRNGADARIW